MQNVFVDIYESVNIMNFENVVILNVVILNIGEEYLEKVSIVEVGEWFVVVMKFVLDVVVDCVSVQIVVREKEVIFMVVYEDLFLDRVSILR